MSDDASPPPATTSNPSHHSNPQDHPPSSPLPTTPASPPTDYNPFSRDFPSLAAVIADATAVASGGGPSGSPFSPAANNVAGTASPAYTSAAAQGDGVVGGDTDVADGDGEGQRQRSEQRAQYQDRHKRHANRLDHLIRNVDIVVYAQISALYYMDCSLLLFLLRALPHWLFFTPKPAFLPPPPPNRPYVANIFATNLVCLFCHILFAAPSAGEAARGYLHGGFLIDFVGELGPVSKIRLVGNDLLVLALQLVLLAIAGEREAVRTRLANAAGGGRVGPGGESGSGSGGGGATTTSGDGRGEENGSGDDPQRQDHDAEEQGILRRDASLNFELKGLEDSYKRWRRTRTRRRRRRRRRRRKEEEDDDDDEDVDYDDEWEDEHSYSDDDSSNYDSSNDENSDANSHSGSSGSMAEEISEETTGLWRRRTRRRRRRRRRQQHHHLDPFYSGQFVVAELHLLETIRRSWRAAWEARSRNTATTTTSTSAATAVAAGVGGGVNIMGRAAHGNGSESGVATPVTARLDIGL